MGYGTPYEGITASDMLAYTTSKDIFELLEEFDKACCDPTLPVFNVQEDWSPLVARLLEPVRSKAESTKLLTEFLVYSWPSNEVVQALNRMRAAIDTPGWGPDILIKIIPDMDIAFFNGLLRHKIHVSWQDKFSIQAVPRPVPAFYKTYGAAAFDRTSGICHIYVNREGDLFDAGEVPRKFTLQTLVHQRVVSINSNPPPPKYAYEA